MDALRISPNYTALDWSALSLDSSDDWSQAVDIVKDRLDGRFLRFASKALKEKDSGFVVLAIDSLMAETIQQFKEGVTDGRNMSKGLVERFLQGPAFQPDFDAAARKAFFEDIRCGLLHQAEARKMWLIRRNQRRLLEKKGAEGYILDVKRFHTGVHDTFTNYLRALVMPESKSLRANLWIKMDQICNVRAARGALYES